MGFGIRSFSVTIVLLSKRKQNTTGDFEQIHLIRDPAGSVTAQIKSQAYRPHHIGEFQSSAVVECELGPDRHITIPVLVEETGSDRDIRNAFLH
jgi:hypothetical protein